MTNNKKLIDLFKSKGLIFPTTSKELEEFEKFNVIGEEKPLDWDDPTAILKRGIQKLDKLNIDSAESLNKEIQELKMVARKGSVLSQQIIEKMKEKHKKNNDK